jgi:hypothetical protein
MSSLFEEPLFREFIFKEDSSDMGVIKSYKTEITGKTKVSVEEESYEGVKIVLKKDEGDSVKEIKFICSCGQSKTIILDYSE